VVWAVQESNQRPWDQVTVSFANGVSVRRVSVPIKSGSVHKGSKTVRLSLSKPASGAALGAYKTAVLAILGK
jgi:hypothetical protein